MLLVALLGSTEDWQGIHNNHHTQRHAGKLFGNAGTCLLLKLGRHWLTTAGELHWLCCLPRLLTSAALTFHLPLNSKSTLTLMWHVDAAVNMLHAGHDLLIVLPAAITEFLQCCNWMYLSWQLP